MTSMTVSKEKSTLTVDESDILAMSEKIRQNQEEDRAFAEQLASFLKRTEKSTDFLHIGKTPNALAIVGADKKLDIVIAPRTIVKCMANPEEHYHGHDLSQSIMEQIPQELRNPVMIFKGSQRNSLVTITELKDSQNRGVMIAISLSEKNGFSEVNRISSIYGRNNMTNYLKAQIEQGNLIAANKEKANKMLHSAGLQLPLENTFIGFDDSVAYSTANVKVFLEKSSENTIERVGRIAKNFKSDANFMKWLASHDITAEQVAIACSTGKGYVRPHESFLHVANKLEHESVLQEADDEDEDYEPEI